MNDLQVENISARYGTGRSVLRDVTFSLRSGEAMLVHGHNGSGKSTLLRVLAGLLPLQTGEVLWRGRKIGEIPFGGPTYPWVGLMFQRDGIFPSLTVERNLNLAAGQDRGKIVERCIDFIPALKPFWKKRAGLLSGGERKLLGFALVIAMDAPLLLLDEPIAGLSTENAKTVLNTIVHRKNDGATIIIVEHSNEALKNELIDIKAEMLEGVLTLETANPRRVKKS